MPGLLGLQDTVPRGRKGGSGPLPLWGGPFLRVAGQKEGGEGWSPSRRSTEVLGTDLGPEWPEVREQGGRSDVRPREEVWIDLSCERQGAYRVSRRNVAQCGFDSHPPGIQRRGGKARDLGSKAGLETSVRPPGALPKSQAPKGRADGARCCAAVILLATRWRWCPSRPQEPREAGRVRQGTGVKETGMEDGGLARESPAPELREGSVGGPSLTNWAQILALPRPRVVPSQLQTPS